jgi:hypothetical protein
LKFANGNDWYDSEGASANYNCAAYVTNSWCVQHGDSYKNEHTANEACCGCDGGDR